MGKKKLTSDNINVTYDHSDSWMPSDGITFAGNGTVDSVDPDFSYSFGDLGQMEFEYDDKTLRKKYPALQDAWDHYQNIKQMCETREKEEDEN